MTANPEDTNLADNHIVGVITGEMAARRAVKELQEAGYRAPAVFSGEEGARMIDAKSEHGSVFGRILSLVQDHLSEATNFLKQYEEEARNGKDVIAVEVPSRDGAEGAREILDRHGAQNIRFFGRLAVAELSPQSNPTARSDSSPERQNPT